MSHNIITGIDLATFDNDELKALIEQAQAIIDQRQAMQAGRKMIKIEGVRVCLDKTGKFAMAITPYHPNLVKEFRTINGKWQSGNSAWVFDARDIDRVREMVVGVFGTDGSTAVEVVDVQVVITGDNGGDGALFSLGRQLASRRGRDASVTLGEGVIIVEGGFPSSAGSAKYPRLVNNTPVTVLVRDVPASLAQKAVESNPETYSIVE